MSLRTLVISFTLLFPLSIIAQREKKVEGEYLYVVPENHSVEQARRTALERAKIQAIADEFGTIITQNNATVIKNQNGETSLDFQSISNSDVKGEWIETIGEPMYEQGFTEEGQMWVKCRVKGRIREIVSAQIDIIAKVLRNGTEEKFEDTNLKSGDDMFLYFKSPTNGFLTIYLINETSKAAYCLLPYSQSSDAVQQIVHDIPYIFFSTEHALKELRGFVDEMTITCDGEREYNDLYIVFSEKPFVKANSTKKVERLPRELSWEDFNKWLVNIRKHDNSMVVKRIMLSISNG